MVHTMCYLFADNTKLLRAIKGANNELLLEQDLDTLNS